MSREDRVAKRLNETLKQNAISMQNLMEMRYKLFEFDGEWYDAFDKPEMQGVWFVWGASGSGKTSFMLRLCKYLTQFGKVAYNSLEEGAALTMRNAIKEAGLLEPNVRFQLLNKESIDHLSIRLKNQRAPDIVVIDSFQYTKMNFTQYLDFVQKHPKKLIIFTSQAKKTVPSTTAAEKVMYDASLKIYVEGFRAFSKGRFIGPKGYYDIWPERSKKHHGDE